MQIIIHTDGGARGNPGPAAIGVVMEEVVESKESSRSGDKKSSQTKKMLASFGEVIGKTTNNVAEYTAVIKALERLVSLSITKKEQGSVKILFFLDSVLVVNQLKGLFKIKENHLKELALRVRILEQEVGGVVDYSSIPREQNRKADALVNAALDSSLT